MEEPIAKANEGEEHNCTAIANEMGRKEKRKALKKMKRKQFRKEIAVKEREEDEARLKDPEQQIKIRMMEQEEAERSERERKEFEEREKAWLEAVELKKKIEQHEEEERRNKVLDEESRELQVQNVNEGNENEDDDWEYIEEGPAEIIWQGNEIIVKKNKVRVPKKDILGQSRIEDADRPTSNPLPPQSEAFADYNRSTSALNVTESITQHVPKFGTEQDKAHCPFHLKTGACRFGQRCSRVHFYPDKSSTLLIKNMFSVPGLSWEQDEELEYTDEELERSYEEFYNDVHTEFLKFGEIVNFKVCRNGSFHLRGNVYVQYRSLDSALCAFQAINGRYFDGKQVRCEFVNVTRWKVAICGEYMKSRFKTCSRGTACNFIHCFRNPGGDYEWADNDKPPPRYWVKQMVALFGYSDESLYLNSSKPSTPESYACAERRCSRRSRSMERDHLKLSSRRKKDHQFYFRSDQERNTSDDEGENRNRFEDICEESCRVKDYFFGKRKTDFLGCDEELHDNVKHVDKEDRETHQGCGRTSSTKYVKAQCRNDDYSDINGLDKSSDRKTYLGGTRTSSRQNRKIYIEIKNHDTHEWLDKDKDMDRHRNCRKRRKSSGKLVEGLKNGDNVRRHRNSVSDIQDDTREPTKKSEDRRNCSSTEHIKADSPFESMRSDGSLDSKSADKEICRSHYHDSRYRPNMPTEENDRWEPEVCSPDIYYKSSYKSC